MPLCRSLTARKQRSTVCKSSLDTQTGPTTNLNVDLNELAGRANLITWPNTLPEVVPAVVATWESLCENQHAMFRCKPSTGVVWRAVTDSPGYSCKVESRTFASVLLVVHTKTHPCRARNVPKRVILVFTALASSFLWW